MFCSKAASARDGARSCTATNPKGSLWRSSITSGERAKLVPCDAQFVNQDLVRVTLAFVRENGRLVRATGVAGGYVEFVVNVDSDHLIKLDHVLAAMRAAVGIDPCACKRGLQFRSPIDGEDRTEEHLSGSCLALASDGSQLEAREFCFEERKFCFFCGEYECDISGRRVSKATQTFEGVPITFCEAPAACALGKVTVRGITATAARVGDDIAFSFESPVGLVGKCWMREEPIYIPRSAHKPSAKRQRKTGE